ncbi:hypothetical protein [Yinghuangia seranimata]|uniref:hypothetical protein n=1 Tax=Yinghuangia seranimata TaxID=408067 RepID=UPI00248AC911|nr:hypothetical protein [Yinghuangia seranimata]MDI2131044.1 hypothetical protein [Yinghuangia seranimata]
MPLAYIALASGRSVELTDLRVDMTYAGVLEGGPFKRLNDEIVASSVRYAEKAFPGTPVHLVEPVRTPLDREPNPRRGPAELLPSVRCVGGFSSAPLDTDLESGLDYSRLVVVWFQPEPALPTSEGTQALLRDIPWESLAEDRAD